MEILHVFGIHWKLLLAQMVNFSIALFVLHRYVYKPIFAILALRQAKLAQGLRDAADAKEERARVDEESATLLRHAREEGGKLVEALHKQGVEAERSIIRDANEKSVALLLEAQTRATEERTHMLRESEKEVARIAVLAAEKILRDSAVKQ